jgi:hypothetical protein
MATGSSFTIASDGAAAGALGILCALVLTRRGDIVGAVKNMIDRMVCQDCERLHREISNRVNALKATADAGVDLMAANPPEDTTSHAVFATLLKKHRALLCEIEELRSIYKDHRARHASDQDPTR